MDQSKVLSCVGDENNILPKRIYRKIRNAIQFVLNMPDQKESTKNVLISECFIRMFVETLGHFSNHIVIQQDGKKIFEVTHTNTFTYSAYSAMLTQFYT